MERAGVGTFGRATTINLNVGETFVDDASPAGSSLPPNLPPGAGALVGFTFNNPGTTCWSAEDHYSLAVLSDPCSLIGASRINLAPGAVAFQNENYQFVAQVYAPAIVGDCAIQLQLMDDASGNFGGTMDLLVHVAEPPNAAGTWDTYE